MEYSNDRAELNIKMEKKECLFANTPVGARSSAVIYSLIETAMDHYRYLL